MSRDAEARPLLFRPRPKPDEAFLGYLLRVAEKNGYRGAIWLLQMAGLSSFAATTLADVSKLATLLDVAPEDLDRIRTIPASTIAVRFGGTEFLRRSLRPMEPRFCPACLEDAPHMRLIWDLAAISCCPVHGFWLHRICHCCGRKLRWERLHLLQCGCGADLRQAPPTEAPKILVDLASLMAAKAGLGTAARRDWPFPPGLLAMPLNELILATAFLGSYALGAGSGTGNWILARSPFEQLNRVMLGAAEIFADWPKAFFALIDRIRARKADRVGLHQEFGQFYLTLSRDMNAPPYAFMQDAFAAYAARNWDGGFLSAKNTRLGLRGATSERFVPKTRAMRELHMREARIDELIAAGKLKAVTRIMGRRKMVLIERASIEAWKRSRGDLVTAKEARKLLGATRKGFEALLQAGTVTPLAGPKVDGAQIWSFSRSEILRLRNALCPGRSPTPTRSTRSSSGRVTGWWRGG